MENSLETARSMFAGHDGNTEYDRGVGWLLLRALKNSNHKSLKAPDLIDVSAMPVYGKGNLRITWISDPPIADGLNVLLANGSEYSYKFHEAEIAYNNRNNGDMFISTAILFLEAEHKDDWEQLIISDVSQAYLTVHGDRISDNVIIRWRRILNPSPPKPLTPARLESNFLSVENENLSGTETLLGDWDGPVLVVAKDFAPLEEVERVKRENQTNPSRVYRHNDGDGRYHTGWYKDQLTPDSVHVRTGQ